MTDSKEAAERREAWIAALEEEKRGYEVRGLPERVKAVDSAIRAARGEVKGRKAKGSDEA